MSQPETIFDLANRALTDVASVQPVDIGRLAAFVVDHHAHAEFSTQRDDKPASRALARMPLPTVEQLGFKPGDAGPSERLAAQAPIQTTTATDDQSQG